ncbi:carbohydrate-binding module family 18 protein [Piromyces sp. E2]|nr:carbohydrate-binding module family 18 protein [Piromyces sp. E2]|eukprot:OUM57352.1 carbohydrate-binding module family 18 protein [Piromyces sp. E2]
MKQFTLLLSAIALIYSASVSASSTTYTNERCGPAYGSCDEGNCCSKFGWCGKSNDHCGTGCQSEFGKCNSDDGVRKTRCGPGYGNCSSGDCCSQYGWCGITSEHCGNGCQSEFGRCDYKSVDQINGGKQNISNHSNQGDNSNNEEIIWNFLTKKIGNKYGAAGLMGNLHVESLLRPDNLEDIYEASLGMSDKEYTDRVNDGSYKNFVSDEAGYGLAQWTYSSRKQALLNYAKKQGTGIDDLNMQLNYLWNELNNDFSGLVRKLKNATSVRQASNDVMFDFEKPKESRTRSTR